jgi:geranylgeranyl diphosphate synthase, type I
VNFSSPENLPALRDAINTSLKDFIDQEIIELDRISQDLQAVGRELRKFVLGSGKRLRPIFAYMGYLGAGGDESPAVLKAAASLELVHVCALIHDDVMDKSDARRGEPSIHKSFELLHSHEGLAGDSKQFGISAAILLGDLALMLSAKMLHTSGVSNEALIRSLIYYDDLRIELTAGQFLDVYEQTLHTRSVDRSLAIARYKSGKYTIERPLHFGASLASQSDTDIFSIYSAYGLPLGEAFQLRDDLLGIFGDPHVTGKPAGDDLREGKRTVLIAKVLEKLPSPKREEFESRLGDEALTSDDIEYLRQLIVDSEAVTEVEELIASLRSKALASLKGTDIPVAQTLEHLATAVTVRST